jgi:hypothetical protein
MCAPCSPLGRSGSRTVLLMQQTHFIEGVPTGTTADGCIEATLGESRSRDGQGTGDEGEKDDNG